MLVFGLKIKFVKDVILKLQFQMLATLCILAWASIHLSSAFSEDIKGKTRSKTVRLGSNPKNNKSWYRHEGGSIYDPDY